MTLPGPVCHTARFTLAVLRFEARNGKIAASSRLPYLKGGPDQSGPEDHPPLLLTLQRGQHEALSCSLSSQQIRALAYPNVREDSVSYS